MAVMAMLAAMAAVAAGPCDDAVSTVAITSCLDRATRTADGRLNAAYRATRDRVPAVQGESLRAAQRLWVGYRDANCRAYAAGEGTIARIAAAQCRLDMTVARTGELARFGRAD